MRGGQKGTNVSGRQILMILVGGSTVTVLAAIATAWLCRSEATETQMFRAGHQCWTRTSAFPKLRPSSMAIKAAAVFSNPSVMSSQVGSETARRDRAACLRKCQPGG